MGTNLDSKLDIMPLASGSSGNCYLLNSPSAGKLLLECGIRFSQIQKRLGYQTSALQGCLVSHQHGDHCHAVPKMLERSIDVYALEDVFREVECSTNNGFAHVIHSGEMFTVGNFWAYPFQLVHCVPNAGFFVGDGQNNVLYLTDTQYLPGRKEFEGVTHLIIEANYDPEILQENIESGRVKPFVAKRTQQTHMSIKRTLDAIDKLVDPDLQEVWLIHLSSANSHEKRFKDIVQKATGAPVYVA